MKMLRLTLFKDELYNMGEKGWVSMTVTAPGLLTDYAAKYWYC